MSNLNHIGFHAESEDDFVELALECINEAESHFETPNGEYVCWSENKDFGPEMWGQAQGDDLMGLHPYFRGKSRMKVGVESPIETEDQTPLDARLYLWLAPETDEPESGVCPCAIDMINFGIYDDVEFPAISVFSIAAFPQEIEIYASEEDYEKNATSMGEMSPEEGDEEEDVIMASESFVPIGLFGEDEDFVPEAYAQISGTVLETQKVKNNKTGKSFTWALVRTLGGTVDVVVSEDFIDTPIIEGGIISGVFWLSADVVDQDNG